MIIETLTEGYVHRGITCDSCQVSPIRGIRYKCANCQDYDLCELCEASGKHDATHVFVKIRIPIPPLANTRAAALPVLYPGTAYGPRWNAETYSDLPSTTQFEAAELEALFAQYKALATSTEGINREVFERGLGPIGAEKNLVTERIFAFFDKDGNGLIDFREFVTGLSVLCGGTQEEKIRHAFLGYDLDGDGFISKAEMHAMFKAYFDLSLRLVRHMMHSLEEDLMDNFDPDSAKPVSAMFTAPIPRELPSAATNTRLVKTQERTGDSGSVSLLPYNDYVPMVDAISEEAISEMVETAFNVADTDGDGRVSFEEFAIMSQRDPSLCEWIDSYGSCF